MSSKQPAEKTPNWGSVALVTYLPDPLGAFLTELRSYFPGEDRPEAHITLLPPRPLALPLEAASQTIRPILSGIEPFGLELGEVKIFPRTNMLYLSIERGVQQFEQLHNSLNDGALYAQEQYEYIPHLTLSGSLSYRELDAAMDRARKAWNAVVHERRFVVHEIVLLWQLGNLAKGWSRVGSFPLLDAASDKSSSAHIGD